MDFLSFGSSGMPVEVVDKLDFMNRLGADGWFIDNGGYDTSFPPDWIQEIIVAQGFRPQAGNWVHKMNRQIG